MNVLDRTLSNLLVRFQWCWCFWECRVPLHCRCSQVHSGPEFKKRILKKWMTRFIFRGRYEWSISKIYNISGLNNFLVFQDGWIKKEKKWWEFTKTDKMKCSFFQAAVTSILLYGCTTWTLTKRLEKKLDGNYTRMLRAILNKSWQQHPTRHQLYGHLPPITKTIQARRTRHAGHCWRSRDELIRDVLLWIPTHGRAKAGRPARTYIQQLCEDTGCCPEDLPRAMNDREEWRERVRDTSAIWWWWHSRKNPF